MYILGKYFQHIIQGCDTLRNNAQYQHEYVYLSKVGTPTYRLLLSPEKLAQHKKLFPLHYVSKYLFATTLRPRDIPISIIHHAVRFFKCHIYLTKYKLFLAIQHVTQFIYRTRAMATCGYNSFFPLFVMKLQLKKWNKKEKLACFLRGEGQI